MTTPRYSTPRPGNARFDECEWQLQENAMREQRDGIAASEDPVAADYRRIAQALHRPLPQRLPSNFAYQMAQLVMRLPRASRLDLRLERYLIRALMVALALGALIAALVYGRDWLSMLDAGGGQGAGTWAVAAAACLLFTWGMEGLRRWRDVRNVGGSGQLR